MSLPRLYTIIAPSVLSAVRFVARPFLPKLAERMQQQHVLLSAVPTRTAGRGRILFHAASMGELEQCVPIINVLTQRDPSLEVVISCSSPSGVRHARTLNTCTAVVYHPFEQQQDIASFIATVQPDAVVIDRYDVWPLFIEELHRQSIPVAIINATFPSAGNNALLRGTIAATYAICSITAVTKDDADAFAQLLGYAVSVLPDSRVDRIVERVANARGMFQHLVRDTPTLIVGSSWEQDLAITLPAITTLPKDTLRAIIVPHEPTDDAMRAIEALLPCTRLSLTTSETQGHILVDSIGGLLSLYACGSAAFVGGGFGAGVHSVLEPAGYGMPLACGPRIERSRDAVALAEQGATTICNTVDDVQRWIHGVVLNTPVREQAGAIAASYVRSHVGSSVMYADAITRMINGR